MILLLFVCAQKTHTLPFVYWRLPRKKNYFIIDDILQLNVVLMSVQKMHYLAAFMGICFLDMKTKLES